MDRAIEDSPQATPDEQPARKVWSTPKVLVSDLGDAEASDGPLGDGASSRTTPVS
jgi:hypothetical protein